MDSMDNPMPALFVSHGSTMMLGEECVVSDDWEEAGRQAELRGVKGIVIMASRIFSHLGSMCTPLTLSAGCSLGEEWREPRARVDESRANLRINRLGRP